MPVRRRATTACVWCHEHKVRCDASTLGHPCTRCQQDETVCVLRKRGTRRSSAVPSAHDGFRMMEPTLPTAVDRRLSVSKTPSWHREAPQGHVSFSSYPFVEHPGLATLDETDVGYLVSKGCFHMPGPALVEELLRQFYLHIQPFTPLIDESVFWSIFRQESTSGKAQKIPLLLIQSMLFAASPYISLATAQKLGFQDKRTCWNEFYKRAKVLYHSQTKDRHLTRAQAALLLTFHTSAEEPQAASLWLTHSIQAAMASSTQIDYGTIDGETTLDKSAQDRLWWSILLRDRSLCIGLRRRPQVLSFEMGMIRDLPDEAQFEAEINGSQVYDTQTRRTLFKTFREQCHLAILLTEMVSYVYGKHGLALPFMSPEGFHQRLSIVHSMQTSLRLWKDCSEIASIDIKRAHSSVAKFTQLNMMYYHAARMDLTHYQALLIEKHNEYLGDIYFDQLSRVGKTLLDATTELTAILEYFSQSGKLQDLPLTMLGYVAMPLVLSAIDFKLSPTAGEMEGRRRLVECLREIFLQAKRVYMVSDFLAAEIDKILQLAYLTSCQVFIKDRTDSRPTQIMPSAQSNPLIIANNQTVADNKALRGRANNWHGAFMRHTRAYLLLSTTVDYFFCVGRLPQFGIPPEFMCFMSPVSSIQLPMSALHSLPSNGGHVSPSQLESDDSSENGHIQLTKQPTTAHVTDPIISPGVSPVSPNSQSPWPQKIDRREYQPEGTRMNLDYLALDDPPLTTPVFGLSVSGAMEAIPEGAATGHSDFWNLDQGASEQMDMWQQNDIPGSYDGFISNLVYESVGYCS